MPCLGYPVFAINAALEIKHFFNHFFLWLAKVSHLLKCCKAEIIEAGMNHITDTADDGQIVGNMIRGCGRFGIG